MRLPTTLWGGMLAVTLALIALAVGDVLGGGLTGILAGAVVLYGGGALVAGQEERLAARTRPPAPPAPPRPHLVRPVAEPPPRGRKGGRPGKGRKQA